MKIWISIRADRPGSSLDGLEANAGRLRAGEPEFERVLLGAILS